MQWSAFCITIQNWWRVLLVALWRLASSWGAACLGKGLLLCAAVVMLPCMFYSMYWAREWYGEVQHWVGALADWRLMLLKPWKQRP
jgi:hypothetical protein